MNKCIFKVLLIPIFALNFVYVSAQIKLLTTEIDTQTVITNLTVPWEILWGPDDHIWMTERNGNVSRANPETGEKFSLLNIPEAYNNGEGGLLGMVLHPDFESTPHVFLVYSYLSGSNRLVRLVRYTYNGSELVSPDILIDSIPGAWNHLGSRLVIDDGDKLYMTTGDAADTELPQDLNSLNGKILRLNLDGSVPEDNPFADSYIYSWGHRNPQGLVIAPNGKIYSSEHGPSDNDEINIIYKNRNYGWPDVHGYCNEESEIIFCEENNAVGSIRVWTPTLAVCGLDYYNHNAIPEWEGKLLLTTLKERDLRSLTLNEDGDSIINEEIWFNNFWGRLRDVCISPDGRVFIAVSNRDGRGDDFLKPSMDDRIIEIKTHETGPGPTIIVNSLKNTMEIYPNPVHDEIYIELTDLPGIQIKINILDISGRTIQNSNVLPKQGVIKINTESLEKGIYFLKISGIEIGITYPFIKR